LRSLLLAILALLLITACHRTSLTNPTPDCRIIQHAMGETCVPLHPQRIVTLSLLDSAIALGVQPVGATSVDGKQLDTLLLDRTANITNIGRRGQANLEAIAHLQPDLILGLDWEEMIYEPLSQIAPTVLVATGDELNWKVWFRAYADAIGKPEAAEQVLQQYNDRIQQLRRQLGDQASMQVSLISFWANTVRFYLKQSFAGQVLSDVGLSRPPAQDKEVVNENISLEHVPQMSSDVIFLMLDKFDPATQLDRFTRHPLWQQLPAVQGDRVYAVDGEAWVAGWNPIAANVILDDLFRFLLKP